MASASPAEVLDALREYLLPQPMAPQLPTALRLYAHLTLVSDAVGEQASAALAIHTGTRRKESKLSAEEVDVLQGCVDRARARSEEMRGLSFDLRRAHLQLVMANPKAPPKQLNMMLDSYFPLKVGGHSMLFISALDEEHDAAEIEAIATHRKELERWLEHAQQAQKAGNPWPAAPKGPRLSGLTAQMFPLAEQAVQDAEAVMRVFEDTPDRRRSLPELTAERVVKQPRASEPSRV